MERQSEWKRFWVLRTRRWRGNVDSMSKKLSDRLSIYDSVSSEFASLSDQGILDFLSKVDQLGKSICRISLFSKVNGYPVFIKKIPLT